MKIVKIHGEKEPTPEPTLLENLKAIEGHFSKLTTGVSEDRQHSVESHLRQIIRTLGFRPRETREARASSAELCKQAISLIESKDDIKIKRDDYDHAQALARTTLSNMAAEVALAAVPHLPEIPA